MRDIMMGAEIGLAILCGIRYAGCEYEVCGLPHELVMSVIKIEYLFYSFRKFNLQWKCIVSLSIDVIMIVLHV